MESSLACGLSGSPIPAPIYQQAVREILHRAWELLRDRRRWAERGWGMAADGALVLPTAADAVAWSLAGAIARCGDLSRLEETLQRGAVDAIKTAHPACPGCGGRMSLIHLNEQHGYAKVMEALEETLIRIDEEIRTQNGAATAHRR